MYFVHQSNSNPPLHHLLLIINISLVFFFFFFFQNPRSSCQAQDGPILEYCPPNSAEYTPGSQFESNLKNLLRTLVSDGSLTGFLNKPSGGGNPTDTVYGLVQCRGDISKEDCRTCLNLSSDTIIQICSNKKDAAIRYSNCLLRYSNVRFFSQLSNNRENNVLWNPKDSANTDNFRLELKDWMKNLISNAGSKDTKFATGSTSFQDFGKIYGLVQCTQDLSSGDCISCLQFQIDYIILQSNIKSKRGGRVISKSCELRFEDGPFYKSLDPQPPPPPPPPPNVGVIVGSIVGGVTLIIALCVYILMRKRRNKAKAGTIAFRENMQASVVQSEGSELSVDHGIDVPFVDFQTILDATDNFSNSNKLGQGGFGPVYKGVFDGGQLILAVKRLSKSSGQGLEEFKNEVLLIAKLQHRNLVRLLGYCIQGDEKILLYEYMPNKSLDFFIFDRTLCLLLKWEKRFNIILGIARGILYLHQDSRLRIIHRDLKTSNVLLDNEMNPKISDFGLARIFEGTQTQCNTSRVIGSYGYMSPEYALEGIFSVKSDVYSFGVILLEIISGKKNSGFHETEDSLSLIGYAWRLWNEDKKLDFIDIALCEDYNAVEALNCIHVGLLCVQEDANDRPTMSTVLYMLDGKTTTHPAPKQPPALVFKRYQSSTSATSSSSKRQSSSTNEMTISEVEGS